LRNEELGIKVYQLVPGYDICVKKSIFKPIQYILFSYALQMQNYIYILADTKTKQCILIDACWDIDGILEHVHKEKLKVIGAIYTHFHIDHTGGIPPPPYNKYMVKVEGMLKLSKIYPNIPFFIGPRDIDFVMRQNPEFNKNRFIPIEDRQILTLDDIVNTKIDEFRIQFIFTPGHTLGSMCILVNEERLFSGDTLLIGTCGRIDLPESSPEEMYDSLMNILSRLDDDIVVYPGHSYGGDEWTTIAQEK
ncbi:Metallo-hydrolase/oxidoreductase, partial [Anaeromyces robustus]